MKGYREKYGRRYAVTTVAGSIYFCRGCRQDLPARDFAPNANRLKGVEDTCRSCQARIRESAASPASAAGDHSTQPTTPAPPARTAASGSPQE